MSPTRASSTRNHDGDGLLRGGCAHRAGGARAFTLLETALTLVIIAVGVLAVIDAQRYFTQGNSWSSHAATATFLANEIRELSSRLPRHDPVSGLSIIDDALVGWGPESGEVTAADFDDIDDFDGLSFRFDGTPADGPLILDDDLPGPIDAFGNLIDDLGGDGTFGWIQTVLVDKVDPFDFAQVLPVDYQLPPDGAFAGLGVDAFPLRVTVIVSYQGRYDQAPEEVARVAWIVP